MTNTEKNLIGTKNVSCMESWNWKPRSITITSNYLSLIPARQEREKCIIKLLPKIVSIEHLKSVFMKEFILKLSHKKRTYYRNISLRPYFLGCVVFKWVPCLDNDSLRSGHHVSVSLKIFPFDRDSQLGRWWVAGTCFWRQTFCNSKVSYPLLQYSEYYCQLSKNMLPNMFKKHLMCEREV